MGGTDARLGGADTAWWHMEEPTNQMVITGVLTFGARVRFATFEHRVRERLLPLAPFHGRLREPLLGIGKARWVPDPSFSLDRHLMRAVLPGAAGDAELKEMVSRVMGEQLDPRYPLWRMYLVDNYAGGSAIVARVHHCIADGMALVQLILTLDDVPGNEGPGSLAWSPPTAADVPATGSSSSVSAPVPAKISRRPTGVRAAAWYAKSLGGLIVKGLDPRTALNGKLGMRKVAAWCEPFPLDEIRAAAQVTGAKINDVIAATIAGALGRYLAGTGKGLPGKNLRAVVPVNLRPADDPSLVGNHFGLVFLSLPVGEESGQERLEHVQGEMRRIKQSAEAGVVYALLRMLGPVGRPVVRLAVWFLGLKASLVYTNVPGPRDAIALFGAPLTGIMAWVPQSGRLSVGFSAVSYAGKMHIGIAADAGIVPDPQALVDGFRDSLRELVDAAKAGQLQEA